MWYPTCGSGVGRNKCVRVFYGWWVVAACGIANSIGNALGLFGAGVYLNAVVLANGWTAALVSGAVSLFYAVSALLLIPVGSGIRHFGPRPVVGLGGLALAAGVIGVGRATEPWHAYLAFLAMGIGWAGLSTTAVATALAPWFDRHQGRAVSTASLGASLGGMLGPPILLSAIPAMGFPNTTTIAGLFALAVLLPLAGLVLRHRPEEIGLFPDGMPPRHAGTTIHATDWSRRVALRTPALRSVMIAFGIGMAVQIGFLTHQIALLDSSISTSAVSMTVSATAGAALVGRLTLARFADRIDARRTTAGVLMLAACSLAAMGSFSVPEVLVGASIVLGLTIGNVTTLSPIIVRREFGVQAFGTVFGVASCCIQLVAATGPSLFGLLRDGLGSYRPALLLAAVLDVAAAVSIVRTGRETRDHKE